MKSSFHVDGSGRISSRPLKRSRSPAKLNQQNSVHHTTDSHQPTLSLPYRHSSYAHQNPTRIQSSTHLQVTTETIKSFNKKSFDTNSNQGLGSSSSSQLNPPQNSHRHIQPQSSSSSSSTSVSDSMNNPHSQESQLGSSIVVSTTGDDNSNVPNVLVTRVPIPEKSKYYDFVREKSSEEVVATLQGLDTMMRKSMNNEKEAEKKQKELINEAHYWKLRCKEIDTRRKEEELQRAVETQKLKENKKHFSIQKFEIIKKQTEKISAGDVDLRDDGESKNHPVPIVNGLPPVCRFPGEAPPPPKRKVKINEKSKKGLLFAVPNLSDLFLKRSEKGKENEEVSSIKSKKPEHNRLQFHWAGQVQGSPRKVSQSNNSIELLTSINNQYSLNEPLTFETNPVSIVRSVETQPRQRLKSMEESRSVYSLIDKTQIINILNDKRIEECFTKKKPENVKKIRATSSTESTDTAKRSSILGPVASQKYQIAVRCFSKAFDGWDGFKCAILQCMLNLQQINLLLDTVPDPENSQGSRKLQEWEELVQKVRDFRLKHPHEDMYEDEAFVHYISSIPNLHQRLQCMNIMNSFNSLLNRFHSEIELIMDCIEILVKNNEIPKLFYAILSIGNFLNEDTNISNKKWFKLESLKKVTEFKGVGKDSKSFLYFLAFHLGPILTPGESNILQKASQIPIAQIIQNVLNISNIFKLLGEQTEDVQGKSILTKKRRNSILPGQADSNDRFAEVGREFVRYNEFNFVELKEDLKRLLLDYLLCCEYFGDVESFIPVDRKINDERNPGQQRYVPDLISIFNEFFGSYKLALKEVEKEREKEKLEATRKEKKFGLTTTNGSNLYLGIDPNTKLKCVPTSQLIEPTLAPLLGEDISSKNSVYHEVEQSDEGKNINVIPTIDSTIEVNNETTFSQGPTPTTENREKTSTFPSSLSILPNQVENEFIPTAIDSGDLESVAKPHRRASLRPSLFGVCPSLLSTTQKFDSTVLKDFEILEQLNETKCSHPSPQEQLRNIDQNDPVLSDATSSSFPSPSYPNINIQKRRESLRAISGIVHNMNKEDSSTGITSGFQFKYIDENNPPFPGARPLPGINSFKQLHQPLHSKNPIVNRFTSNRSALASLPECPHESETPPSSPFSISGSRSRQASLRHLVSPVSFEQSSSVRRPRNLQHEPTEEKSTQQERPSSLNFTRATSASTARNTLIKASKEEALKKIRSTIFKDRK